MPAKDPSVLWSETLANSERRVAELRKDDSKLREAIGTPMSYDTGKPPGNAQLEGILTLASWAGVVLGGLAAIITFFFTTGIVLWILVGITVLSAGYAIAEMMRNGKQSGPWYAESRIATGGLLVANEGLYEPGKQMLPGGMLVTFDRELAGDPDRMHALVERLMACYEEEQPTPADLQAAVAWIDSDIATPSFTRIRLPKSFAGNDQTWLVCLGIDQSAMPNGCLDRTLWPVFGREDKNEAVVLLPHKLWYRGEEELDAIMRERSA